MLKELNLLRFINQEIDLNAELGSKLLSWNKDATDLSNLTHDGTSASNWLDSSGNGNDIGQIDATERPLLDAEGLLFDGVNDVFNQTIALDQFEIFVVCKQVTFTDNGRIVEAIGTNRFMIQQKELVWEDTRIYSYGSSASTYSQEHYAYPTILKAKIDGVSSLFQDMNFNNNGLSAVTSLNYGNRTNSANGSNIILREIVITELLTDPERDKVIERLSTYLPDPYVKLVFKVIDDVVDSQTSANTGLAYDKTRRLIYSGVSPYNSITTGIHVFNEEGVFQSQLPIEANQGFDYNPINDQFIVWTQGGATASLITYNYDGSVVYTQSNFDPFAGQGSGSVCYDYVDDRLLVSYDGATDIKVYVKSGNDWIYDHDLGAVNPQEGIAFDENTDTYWYNRTNEIVNITKAGVEIKTIPHVAETYNVNEGLAWNPFTNTIYVNSDKYYHGTITDGNRCVELNPTYFD